MQAKHGSAAQTPPKSSKSSQKNGGAAYRVLGADSKGGANGAAEQKNAAPQTWRTRLGVWWKNAGLPIIKGAWIATFPANQMSYNNQTFRGKSNFYKLPVSLSISPQPTLSIPPPNGSAVEQISADDSSSDSKSKDKDKNKPATKSTAVTATTAAVALSASNPTLNTELNTPAVTQPAPSIPPATSIGIDIQPASSTPAAPSRKLLAPANSRPVSAAQPSASRTNTPAKKEEQQLLLGPALMADCVKQSWGQIFMHPATSFTGWPGSNAHWLEYVAFVPKVICSPFIGIFKAFTEFPARILDAAAEKLYISTKKDKSDWQYPVGFFHVIFRAGKITVCLVTTPIDSYRLAWMTAGEKLHPIAGPVAAVISIGTSMILFTGTPILIARVLAGLYVPSTALVSALSTLSSTFRMNDLSAATTPLYSPSLRPDTVDYSTSGGPVGLFASFFILPVAVGEKFVNYIASKKGKDDKSESPLPLHAFPDGVKYYKKSKENTKMQRPKLPDARKKKLEALSNMTRTEATTGPAGFRGSALPETLPTERRAAATAAATTTATAITVQPLNVPLSDLSLDELNRLQEETERDMEAGIAAAATGTATTAAAITPAANNYTPPRPA